MALARFKALNVDSSEDSEGDEENPAITREALEEKAAAQYRDILVLQRNKKWKEAEAEFKELLNSDVLNRVSGTVNYVSGRIQPSLIHLKYCLLVNLGHVLIETGQIKEALDSYLQAIELDDRDLNLWYRIGQTAIKIPNLNLAAYALQEALGFGTVNKIFVRFPSRWWPDEIKGFNLLWTSLDRESQEYEKEAKALNGLKLDDTVLTRDIRSEVDETALDKLIEEADQLRSKHVAQTRCKQNDEYKLETLRPEAPLPKKCWVAVGRTLLQIYARLKEEYPKASFLRLVDLGEEAKDEKEEDKEEKKTDYDWYDADDDDNSDDEVAKLTEGGLTGNNEPGGVDGSAAAAEEGVNGAVRASKRRRSSPSLLDQWMYSSKRRSARVRSTACGRRGDEPSLARSLRQLLPEYLWPSREAAQWALASGGGGGDESMDTMDLYRLFETKDNANEQMPASNVLSYSERTKLIKEEKYFNTDKEVEDINHFIKENNLVNILTLITSYVKTMAQKWDMHWSPALIAIYIKVYKLVRQHYPEACQSEPLDAPSAAAVLLYGELLLDRWLTNGKQRATPSPLSGSLFGGDFSSLSFGNLAYVCANECQDDAEFVIRCYWLEAMMYLHVKSRDAAMIALERYLADGRCCGVHVKLKNVVNNFTIDEDNVMRLYNTLKRNEDLDKVTELFARGQQDKACEILKQCLQPASPLLAADYCDPLLDRCSQFSLLLDSLFERQQHADCLVWCEMAAHEALAQYRATDDSHPSRARWSSLLTNTLIALPLCIEEGDSRLLEKLPHSRLVRMIQTMSNVICLQMEAPSDSSEIPLGTVAPWIVIYHIVKYDEEKTGRVHDEDDISASLNVLLTAHEYLGKRSWCLMDEAEILYKILGVTIPLMESGGGLAAVDSELLTTLCHHTEQAFYCLYGHPLKKNKPRHIIEHNAMGLALTWNRSQLVYRYFKPRELPMYDSSVRCSITQDTEALFRRIVGLVPADMDPGRQVEATTAYIEGHSERVPVRGVQLSPPLADIYYLIADYYFKNKLWSKALRYYALDISANPSRVDSWACLALAHGSQLETKLNSCEPLSSEQDFLRSARMACKCYGRALQLDPEQSTLWIEYGSFAYMVHSFCSRLLKQEPPNLSLELFDALEKQKEQMLDQAYTCFTSASVLWTSFEKKGEPEIQDERWLHHYMFGKIALKREEKPQVYLTHFMKAMRYLHQNNANYPKSVSYSNPQLYCIEALELYYRVHACVLKVLEQSENRSVGPEVRRLFFETLEKIALGPFANYGEVTSDYFYEDELPDVPLVETDVCYTLNNIVNIVSGEESVYCRQRLQKRSHKEMDVEEGGEEEDEPACKMMKNDEGEAVKCVERIENEVEGEKVLKKQKSNVSESSVNENSPDNTDKSEDEVKKTVKKPTSTTQESSSETLSDSDESSSDSDSSSGESSSEDSNSASSEASSQESSAVEDNGEEDKEPPKKKMKVTKVVEEKVEDEGNWKEEQRSLIDRCLLAMVECQRRFPEHYKSIYRQTHYYFHSKVRSDVNKVRNLLLNEGGLFADRRSTNFFNGVWRIPSSEIDRPGSFAGHMSRCLHLLLDLLRDSKDFKMLLSLALQLKDTPDPDKKYLRDTEREQLAREALSQCVQVLRNKLMEANDMTKLRLIVMEVFKAHRKINKLWPQREKIFNALLTQAYQKYLKFKGDKGDKSTFEAASKFCLQEINQTGSSVSEHNISFNSSVTITTYNEITISDTVTNVTATVSETTVTVTPSTTSGPTTTSVTPTTTVAPNETTVKVSSVPAPVLVPPTLPGFPPPVVKRPRGRPPNLSIRQQNPASFLKAAGIPTSKELQMMYQNLTYSKNQLPFMMPPNPLATGLTLQQQITLQTEFLRQMTSQMAQVSGGKVGGASGTKQPNIPLPSMKPPSFLTEKPPKIPSLPKLPPLNFPHTDKSLKSYGKSSKTSKHSSSTPHSASYSKAASSVVQNVSQIRPASLPSMAPSNPTPPAAQSLQHKLLSAKKAKIERQKSSIDILLGSSNSSSMLVGASTSKQPVGRDSLGSSKHHSSSRDPLSSSKHHSTPGTSNRDSLLGSSKHHQSSRSDLAKERYMSQLNKMPKSLTADPKSLLKDLTITPSGFNPDFGSAFSSALNKEDITLSRVSQSETSRIADLASCSFVDSASKKIKSMFLPHIQAPPEMDWKPRGASTSFEPRISSALAAIGTQLTITPTSSTMTSSKADKKLMAAPSSQQLGGDVIKYGKADVSIAPVKEKPPTIDPTIIEIE
ncbi:hypothetical protein LSTR_LSTR004130 [Laodelphax striatellus]|uniref:Calcineurin-binding protein cabin-1 MEF2-binding domain-containing protein n=1 Tax=Laodelphax striatellus TaxID=195883 RepID=A0A482WHF4_LAOST|nr:hypothetical protein LSTR_LSTR004130 [Laodelphax striatellus]